MTEAFVRELHGTEEEWLYGRAHPTLSEFRLTGTNAAAICGHSPWQTKAQLFDEKTGKVKPRDISGKPYVVYGKRMEPIIRDSMMIDLPYFSISYNQYDILTNRRRPHMSATLDGELTVSTVDNPWMLRSGARGILECKTGSFRGNRDLEEWERGIPIHYYEQVLHQLAVTEWEFAIVAARLIREGYRDEDCGFPEIRNYYRIVDCRNASTREDINYLVKLEDEFLGMLTSRTRPPLTVKFGE